MEYLITGLLLIYQMYLLMSIKRKVNKIMGAQAVTTATMEQVLALIQEALNTNLGDLTEAEAEAQREEFVTRLNAIINPPPTP